ncbi:hypothetical protein NZK32_04420 [Cyanobium sp. FGCU-52]|nr:hypothetical protein [Cyanobium sp. FGCU52]
MAVALIGGGSSLLSAGSAQAVAVSCNTDLSWEVGDKRISNILCSDFEANLRFAQGGLTYDFGALFDPLPTAPEEGWIYYTLEVINPDPLVNFTKVELDSDCDDISGGACNVVKDIFYTALDVSDTTTIFANRSTGDESLSSPNGEQVFGSITGRTIYVLDSWAPAAPAALSGIENVYTQTSEVPGPLPVLGAGMAFGFSRKLRRRIQGQRVTA